jgi:hypothetical protein
MAPDQILLGFLGPEFMEGLKASQEQKILIIQSCGPSMTNAEHFRVVKNVVQE